MSGRSRRRGRPNLPRDWQRLRVVWLYTLQHDWFEWVCASARCVPPEMVEEHIGWVGDLWPSYMDSMGWATLQGKFFEARRRD